MRKRRWGRIAVPSKNSLDSKISTITKWAAFCIHRTYFFFIFKKGLELTYFYGKGLGAIINQNKLSSCTLPETTAKLPLKKDHL